MKKHITFGLFALCMAMGFAQRHEIGIKGGYSIVGGDAKSVIRSFPDAGTNILQKKPKPKTGDKDRWSI